jgi:transcription initiation factor TFIIH subunit 2
MADSDGEYVQDISSGAEDDHDVHPDTNRYAASTRNQRDRHAAGRSSTVTRGKERARERWEGSLQERNAREFGAMGAATSTEDLVRISEARKRARYVARPEYICLLFTPKTNLCRIHQDLQPFQRGIIRHLVLVLDLSEAMLEKDMRPNRFLVMLRTTVDFIRDFFEQNPISQLSVLGMYDGKCIRVSDLSGNPNDHITAIQRLRTGNGKDDPPKEPKGSPSLQNALEMCRAMLYHTPKHGTREVLIILGALLSNDPGDIHQTIAACVKDRIRVSVIGMLARLKVCQDIVSRTNGADESGYSVAVDQYSFRDLLRSITAPPAIRSTEEDANMANLLIMGFPSRMEEDEPSLCACHGNLTRGGYICPRCETKVCSLPQTCPSCGLTLILSTHLARSYHHLFPLRNFMEVSWARAKEMKSLQCKGCYKLFPPVPQDLQQNGERDSSENTNDADGIRQMADNAMEGSSESARYECQNCFNHFCVDCDVFCHQTLFNCPGCVPAAS